MTSAGHRNGEGEKGRMGEERRGEKEVGHWDSSLQNGLMIFASGEKKS